MEIGAKYGRSRFASKKKEMIEARRLARAKNENARYEGIVGEMIEGEQELVEMKMT